MNSSDTLSEIFIISYASSLCFEPSNIQKPEDLHQVLVHFRDLICSTPFILTSFLSILCFSRYLSVDLKEGKAIPGQWLGSELSTSYIKREKQRARFLALGRQCV